MPACAASCVRRRRRAASRRSAPWGVRHPGRWPPDTSFDLTVPEPASAEGASWEVPLEATLGDGDVLRRSVSIEPCLDRPGPDDDKVVEDEGAPFAEVVRAGAAKSIAFGGVKLDIPEGAVDKDVRITVRPLVADQVPPMDARMANVSADGRAFRFGPHGLKFKKPVKITLPYDPKTLRPGMHERDVVSFYYDTTQKKWSRIGRYGTAEGGMLTSLTEHFTDFVNATLAMPDEPGPQSFNPNEMKGIKLASPSTGLDLIAPPQANGSGTVQLSYPIEVPPGRGGIEPQLAFAYDSAKKDGWPEPAGTFLCRASGSTPGSASRNTRAKTFTLWMAPSSHRSARGASSAASRAASTRSSRSSIPATPSASGRGQ